MGVSASVLDKTSLETAKKEIHEKFGSIDILINGAGGNSPEATTKLEKMDGTADENIEETFLAFRLRELIKYLILTLRVHSFQRWFSRLIW